MDEQMKTPDEMQAEWDAAIKDAGVPTEAQMRDAAVPWPQNEEELVAYIRTLVDRPHGLRHLRVCDEHGGGCNIQLCRSQTRRNGISVVVRRYGHFAAHSEY